MARSPHEIQEVRLAMALNGGVSLAVWMGGCAVELDCARRAHWGPDEEVTSSAAYRSLCEAFGRELVIDIMSGASAGGVNGGLLAGAMVSGRRLHPTYVRDQWLLLGDFSELLHPSTDPSPRSLLRGEHFIDSLLEVFRELMGEEKDAREKGLLIPDSQKVPPKQPLPHLDVTVTDVRGTERTYRDKWGGTFAAREYRRRFSFRKQDDFTPENLAVAARSSASFPAAFEPYRAEPETWRLTERPGLKPSGEASPWTIDGGLLDNAPIRAAIELIPKRPASRQVKRYLVYVNPEPHETLEPTAATVGANADGKTPSDEPELANVAGYVISLPRKLPFVDQLDAIEDAVQRSALIEGGALDLLAAPLETLEGVATALLPAYASRRMLKSLQELLDDPGAAENAYRTLRDTCSDLPWIPSQLDLGDPVEWNWGLSTAIRICHFLLDLIRMQIAHDHEHLPRLLEARTRLDEPLGELESALAGANVDQQLISDLRSDRPKLNAPKRVAGLQGLAGDQQAAALPAVRNAICVFVDLLRDLGNELTLPPPREDKEPEEDCCDDDETRVDVGVALFGEGWHRDDAFREQCDDPCKRADGELTEPERHCLRRLLAIEVIRRAYTAEEPIDSAQQLSFVQLTPDAPTPIFFQDPFEAPPGSAEDKLTGIRLGHFAGFLKRSWRANDFMWGRLDAAARIVDLLVDPKRANELGLEDVAEELTTRLLEGATPEHRSLLAKILQEPVGEGTENPQLDPLHDPLESALIADLDDPDGDACFTRTIFTHAAQREIVRAELPAIAESTREDASDGSSTKPIDFGPVDKQTREFPTDAVLEQAITNVRDGKPLPVRLGRDDPAETTSDLTARMAARAGFVTLAALRTAKLPAAGALNVLRPPLLGVTGMSARGFFLRLFLLVGYWSAAMYLAARALGTDSATADLGSLISNQVLLALIAVVAVIGVALLPFVRGIRRKSRPVGILEFAAAAAVVILGGGATIGLVLGFANGLSPAKLIIAHGYQPPPDLVVDLAVVVALGLPLTRAVLLSRLPGWMLRWTQRGFVSALLLAVVAGLVSGWTLPALVTAVDHGPTWRTIAALSALCGPPVIWLVYTLSHNVSMPPRSWRK